MEKSKFKEDNKNALINFLSYLEILDFGSKEAMVYAKIRADLEVKRELIGAMDMLISAVALTNNLTLITNNTKEFIRVNALKLENWV